MANEFIMRKGYKSLANSEITGSLTTTGDINAGGNRIVLQDNGTIQWGSSANFGNLTWDTGYALIYGQGGKGIKFGTNGSTLALTLDTSQNATFTGDVTVDSEHLILKGSSPEFYFHTSGNHVNWVIAAQESTNATLEFGAIAASTSLDTDASQYTPVLKLGQSGTSTFAGNVTINSTTNVGLTLEHATRPTFTFTDGINNAFIGLESGGAIITGTTDNTKKQLLYFDDNRQ